MAISRFLLRIWMLTLTSTTLKQCKSAKLFQNCVACIEHSQ
uniref:Uncharacterized protein n=1 Tax=Arundo donax TaxID=35708 RepID=A0A0A9F0B7_ARUDO